MFITVDPKASQWFQSEMEVKKGESIRFLGKVYGETEIHEGFSIGIRLEAPKNPLAQTIVDGITYYIETQDEWFFHSHNLEVKMDSKLNEPSYHFIKNNIKNK